MADDDLTQDWDDDFKAELDAIEKASFSEFDDQGNPMRKAHKRSARANERSINNTASFMNKLDANADSINSADLSDLDEGEYPSLDI